MGCSFVSLTSLLNCFQSAADAYNHTDSEFLKSENNQNRDAGSTASTAILVGDRLLVANVGDSRAVICRGGNGKIHRFYFCFLSFIFISFMTPHMKLPLG